MTMLNHNDLRPTITAAIVPISSPITWIESCAPYKREKQAVTRKKRLTQSIVSMIKNGVLYTSAKAYANDGSLLAEYQPFADMVIVENYQFIPYTPAHSIETKPLLLPAPHIAGLLPAPKPSHIGKTVAVAGLSQTCTIIKIYDYEGEQIAMLEHTHGMRMVAHRRLATLGLDNA